MPADVLPAVARRGPRRLRTSQRTRRRDVGVVLGRLGLQEPVQPFKRVVRGPPGDPGKVVDLLAEAAHVAHLVDDAFALHAP